MARTYPKPDWQEKLERWAANKTRREYRDGLVIRQRPKQYAIVWKNWGVATDGSK